MLIFERDRETIDALFQKPLISFSPHLHNFWFATTPDGGERDVVFPMSLSLACGTYRNVHVHQVNAQSDPSSNRVVFTIFTEDESEKPYRFSIAHYLLVSKVAQLPSISNVIWFGDGDTRNYYDMLVALYLELHPEHVPSMFLDVNDWLNIHDCMYSTRSNYIKADMTDGDCQAVLFSLRAFCGMIPMFNTDADEIVSSTNSAPSSNTNSGSV